MMFFYRNAGVLFRGCSCNPRHPPGAHHLQPLPPPPPSSKSLLRLEKDESSLKKRQTVKSDKTTDWKSSMTFSYLLIYKEIDFTYYDIASIAKAVQSHCYFHHCNNSILNCWQSRKSFSLSFWVPLAYLFSFLVRSSVRGHSSLLWLLFMPDHPLPMHNHPSQWTILFLVELSSSVKKGSYSLAFGCSRNKKGWFKEKGKNKSQLGNLTIHDPFIIFFSPVALFSDVRSCDFILR